MKIPMMSIVLRDHAPTSSEMEALIENQRKEMENEIKSAREFYGRLLREKCISTKSDFGMTINCPFCDAVPHLRDLLNQHNKIITLKYECENGHRFCIRTEDDNGMTLVTVHELE